MPNNLNYLQSNENMLTLRTSDYMTKYYIESIRNIKKGIAAKQARQNNELFDEVYSIFFSEQSVNNCQIYPIRSQFNFMSLWLRLVFVLKNELELSFRV